MNPLTNSRLLVILGDAVKEVQLCISCPGRCKRYESNVATRLIHALDHVLLDGLRHPKNGYWPVFAAILPSSALSFINQLFPTTNNIGKGRAWLLLSLNEAVLEALLATLEGRQTHLSEYYLPNALLRDSTSLQVVVTLVSGLEHVGFDFLLDSAVLDATRSPSSGELVYEQCQSNATRSSSRGDFLYEQGQSNASRSPSSGELQYEQYQFPLENDFEALRQDLDDFIRMKNDSFLGDNKTTMPAPMMKSPLVKRRSSTRNLHVRSSTQKRVSFHQDMMRRPYDASLHHATSQTNLDVSSCVEDGPTSMNLRRYHSELTIDHAGATVTLAKYPTIAERGVPEGQEDPAGAQVECAAPRNLFLPKAVTRRKLLMGDQPKMALPSTVDKRRFLDWAERKWRDLELVPVLPPLNRTTRWLDIDANDLVIDDLRPIEDSLATLPVPIEMDRNQRYKSFQCYTNFYSGLPWSSQLVISPTMIYVVSSTAGLDNNSPSIVWKSQLIDLENVEVKCNYSVIVMRSTSVEPGGYYCLDFADPADLQTAASLIDVHVRRLRQDHQCVDVESVSQCRTYWQSRVVQWMQHDHHSIDVKCPIDVTYIGLLYFEESFVMQSRQASPTLVAGPNKSGHLMFRWSNTRSWHAGYFIIKDGELCQFNQASDRVPMLKVSLGEEQCKGYGRNFHSPRPHTIELQLRNQKSLLLAAASECQAAEWLTSLSLSSSGVCDNGVDVASPSPVQDGRPIACGVLVTGHQVFLFQSTDQRQPVASAALDLMSVIMISPTDTFCLIELDYREASEGAAGDWILYFQSENSFELFLQATKRPREILSTASSSTLRNKSLLLRAI